MKGYSKLTKEESKDLYKVRMGEESSIPFNDKSLLVKCVDDIFGSKILYSAQQGQYLLAIWNLNEYEICNALIPTKKECEELIYEAALIRGGHYEGYYEGYHI